MTKILAIPVGWASIITGCSSEIEVQQLGTCWSVNKLRNGEYTGKAVLIKTMHGYVLHSLACAPSEGINELRLSQDSLDKLENFWAEKSTGSAVSINFVGTVKNYGQNKLIYITRIDKVEDLVNFNYRKLRSDSK